MKLLGLGRDQLLQVPECGSRLDAEKLEAILDELHAARRPVLLAVAMFGTTEFGTVDPIHDVVALRESCAKRGFGFSLALENLG